MFQTGVGLFCVEIEVPIPTPPVTSNSASGDTGDQHHGSGTGVGDGVGGGGDGNCCLLFVGSTESSLTTGGFVYRGHTAAVTYAKLSPSGTYVASRDARGRLRIW